MNIIPLNDAMLATIKLALVGTPIQGPTGKSAYEEAVANGFVGTTAEWLESLNGEDGLDGREVNLRMTATHLQWRLGAGEWIDLYPLANLYIELRKTATHIQWKLGIGNWVNLVPLTDITGPKGYDGWTMIPAMVPDGNRRIIQIVDWIGGQGVKPETGQYVGPNGLVYAASAATDLRGANGPGGGDMLTTQNLNDLTNKPAARDNLQVYSIAAVDQAFAEVSLALADKQANLGFAPVEEGGGTDQVAGKVQIGRTAANRLKAQVAGTDYGFFVFEAQLNAALNQKLNSSAYSWNTLPDKPLTFNPSAHNHPISGVDGLQTALDARLLTSSVSEAANGQTVVKRRSDGGINAVNLSINTGFIYADNNNTVLKTGAAGQEKYWRFDGGNGYLYGLLGGSIWEGTVYSRAGIQVESSNGDQNYSASLNKGWLELRHADYAYIDITCAPNQDYDFRIFQDRANNVAGLTRRTGGTIQIGANGGIQVMSGGSRAGVQSGDVLTNEGGEQFVVASKNLVYMSQQNPQDPAAGAALEIRGQGDGYGAWMKFHRPGAHGSYFGMHSNGQYGHGGWSTGAVIYTFWDNRNLPRPIGSYNGTLTDGIFHTFNLGWDGARAALQVDNGGAHIHLARRGYDEEFRDITAHRGDGTGVIYLGGGKYLYNDGGSYQLPGQGAYVGGRVHQYGRPSTLTFISAGDPGDVGGQARDGDIWIVP